MLWDPAANGNAINEVAASCIEESRRAAAQGDGLEYQHLLQQLLHSLNNALHQLSQCPGYRLPAPREIRGRKAKKEPTA